MYFILCNLKTNVTALFTRFIANNSSLIKHLRNRLQNCRKKLKGSESVYDFFSWLNISVLSLEVLLLSTVES